MKKRDYRDYLSDILESIDDIESFTNDMSFDDFVDDKKTLKAVIRSIEVMGEATKRIPESIRAKYPNVPWKKMAGMRDKLIHEYHGVDLEILWKTINEDIPPVKQLIIKAFDDHSVN
jgi:uncharacterized protein with HEPN domain